MIYFLWLVYLSTIYWNSFLYIILTCQILLVYIKKEDKQESLSFSSYHMQHLDYLIPNSSRVVDRQPCVLSCWSIKFNSRCLRGKRLRYSRRCLFDDLIRSVYGAKMSFYKLIILCNVIVRWDVILF